MSDLLDNTDASLDTVQLDGLNTDEELKTEEDKQLEIDEFLNGSGNTYSDDTTRQSTSIMAKPDSETNLELDKEEYSDFDSLWSDTVPTAETVTTDVDTVTPVATDVDTGVDELQSLYTIEDLGDDEGDLIDNSQITIDFFNTDAVQRSMGEFMVDRYGQGAAKKEGESKSDYADRFFSKMRWMEHNMGMTGLGLAWMSTAEEEQKQNFGFLYTAYTDMPSFHEEGGGGSWNVVTDSIMAGVFDATNVATLGASMGLKLVGGRMAARTALRYAIRSNAGKIAGAVAGESLVGMMHESALQSIQVDADMRTEKDWSDIVWAGAISGAIGGTINTGSLWLGARDKTYADKLKSKVTAAYTPDADTIDAAARIDESLAGMDSIFDVVYARGMMDDAGPSSDALQSQVTPEVLKEAKAVIGKLMIAVPHFQPDFAGGEKVSDAMYRVFDALALGIDSGDTSRLITDAGIDIGDFNKSVTALNKTLADNNIDIAEFGEITRFTQNQSALVLTGLSQLSKSVRKIQKYAPEVLEFLEEPSAQDIHNATFGRSVIPNLSIGETASKWDRIRRAILTSQPVTSARNAFSATNYVMFDTVSEIMLNTVEGLGKAVRAVGEGNASVAGTVKGTKDIFVNSFGLVGKLSDTGLTRETAEALLEGHPALHQILLRTTQEAGTNTLPKVVTMLNALNIAQDQFIRSAVFVESIERQMRGSGMDVMQMLGSKKPIPTSVVKKAVDDSLRATFADVPKGGMAHKFVSFVETFPFVPVIGTAAFPFARFMASALSFQYRYSPVSSIGGLVRMNSARVMKNKGQKGAVRLNKQAKKDLADSAIGTGALIAAYYYRANNRDVPVDEMRIEGQNSTMNIMAFFPLPFYMAAGEMLFQASDEGRAEEKEVDVAKIVQGFTGAQVRASQANAYMNWMSESAQDALKGMEGTAGEKFGERAGKFAGEMVGQYATTGRVLRDVLGAFDAEMNVVRNPNVITGSGGVERGLDAFKNQIIKNQPYISESLPAQVSSTRTEVIDGKRQAGIMTRQAPYLTQMTGAGILPNATKIERELVDMGYPLWTISPRKGDSQYDAAVKSHMAMQIEEIMGSLFESDDYKNLATKEDKIVAIHEMMKIVKVEALEPAQAEMGEIENTTKFNPVDRAAWGKVPKVYKDKVERDYFEEYGVSISNDGAYLQALDLYKDAQSKYNPK